MKKSDLPKVLGGITVMFSVFLLMILASRFDQAVDGAKYALSLDSGLAETMTTTLVQQTGSRAANPPANIIEGFFNVSEDGDVTETKKENGQVVTKHYRAIQSNKIKASEGKIVLKLQVYNDDKESWVTTDITRIDKEDGKVYFLLKTEESESIQPGDYYTGTYQLIFQ